MIKSSTQREICSIRKEPHYKVSSTKSRSATAFREFGSTLSKPSSLAMAWRSILKGLPARAPHPKGDWFTRLATSSRRSRSDAKEKACDNSQWLNRIGCAFCKYSLSYSQPHGNWGSFIFSTYQGKDGQSLAQLAPPKPIENLVGIF